MNILINKRDFLQCSLTIIAATSVSIKIPLMTPANKKIKKPYILCGKIGQIDLRHYYKPQKNME